jgi:sterol desaturase/sphingolipid hydroxylase (fatty acid hydroxylase superfamily)
MAIIEASIPLFFLLIIVELLVARRRQSAVYRLNDSISDLSCGILSQLLGVFTKLLVLGTYVWFAAHLSLQHFGLLPAWIERVPFGGLAVPGASGIDWAAWGSWTAAFLLVDLAYYFLHRYSHTIHVLWAGHVVHHSSEEYNLTVALRQSALHGILSWVFFIPLAIIGLPWQLFAACYALNLVYQFWIHTREIDRLPLGLEWWLNTPSHHRVHHGVNPQYQDKNYAGALIIWDRLFGTFEPEQEPVVYGITTPLESWNPVWANVHIFADIVHDAVRTRRWRDKWRVVFGHPGFRPADLAAHSAVKMAWPLHAPQFDPVVPRVHQWYAAAQFLAILVAAYLTLVNASTMAAHEIAAMLFVVTIGLANVGAIFEGRSWVFGMEFARLATIAVAASIVVVRGEHVALASVALVISAVSSIALLNVRARTQLR